MNAIAAPATQTQPAPVDNYRWVVFAQMLLPYLPANYRELDEPARLAAMQEALKEFWGA